MKSFAFHKDSLSIARTIYVSSINPRYRDNVIGEINIVDAIFKTDGTIIVLLK